MNCSTNENCVDLQNGGQCQCNDGYEKDEANICQSLFFFYITFKYLNVRTLFVTIKLNYKVISTITGETYIKTKNSKENEHEI